MAERFFKEVIFGAMLMTFYLLIGIYIGVKFGNPRKIKRKPLRTNLYLLCFLLVANPCIDQGSKDCAFPQAGIEMMR